MMVVADLGTAQTAEEAFRRVGASAVQAVSGLVVDPPGVEPAMQRVPVGSFVRVDGRGAVEARPNEVGRSGFAS
jgi:hypothetical protein